MRSLKSNILDNLNISSKKEIFKTIFEKDDIKIERIVSFGQKSDKNFWYDQNQYEFVILIKGEAELEFENSKLKLKENDYLIIKPHEKHRVTYTSKPAVWLCFFFK